MKEIDEKAVDDVKKFAEQIAKKENEVKVTTGKIDLDPKQKKAESKRIKKERADFKRQQNDMKKQQKVDIIQELDVYWKLDGKGKAKLAIKLTKGERTTVILKDPKYLKSLRGHLQTVAKFGLRKNFI